MVAIDSSALVAYLEGDQTPAATAVGIVLGEHQACLPPVVLSEILSEPDLPAKVCALIKSLPLLEVTDGYWERAGALRSKLIARNLKARLTDTLIAQSCLDHDVALVTTDRDFRHFVKHGKLRLLP